MSRLKVKSLVLFASVITLAVIGAMIIPWLNSGNSSQEGLHLGSGIALAAPNLQTGAFPAGSAGLSAYLDVGAAVADVDDLGEVGRVCTTVPAFSQTHVLCQVTDAGLSLATINLYADTNGLVVAYLANNVTISAAGVWSGDASLPGTLFQPVFESPTLALDDIVKRAVERVGVDYASVAADTGYFDWEFPAATTLTVIVKTENTGAVQDYHFSRPNDPIFEASGTGYGINQFNSVFINNAFILNTRSGYRGGARGDVNIPLTSVAPDLLHRVGNQPQIGSAIYLLWTPSP